MRIALVHDDLMQWGGAEKMLVGLCEAFPDAPIFTSLIDWSNPFIKHHFQNRKVFTSFLQKSPHRPKSYKALLPLYPMVFEQFDFSDFDIVISHSTRFAKAIITKPQTKHICYCQTPPRFLWNFSGEHHSIFLQPYLSYLRKSDQIYARRVDYWVANSQNVKRRIKRVYKQPSEVIYPYVDYERLSQYENFNGGYLLTIARLNKYKRVDIVIEAAKLLRIPLKIVGTGPEEKVLKAKAPGWIEFVGAVDDHLLGRLLAGCKVLVVAAEEDFGITPLEAQSVGKPVIALGKGGVVETVIEGETGYFFDTPSVSALISALKKLDKEGYNEEACRKQAQQFSKIKFLKQFRKLVSSI